MTIALLSHQAAAGNSSTQPAVSATNTTGATLIVIALSSYSNATAPTPTDLESNTWVPMTAYQNPGNTNRIQFFYCFSPITSSVHTFSSISGSFGSMAVAAFSGTALSGTADVNTGSGAGSGSGTIQPGSGTPSVNNEILLTALSIGSTGTAAVDSGFTITDQVAWSSGVNEGVALAYLIQTTKTAENPAWTDSGLVGAAAMASFKPPSVASGGLLALL